jgi:hypothetical protein
MAGRVRNDNDWGRSELAFATRGNPFGRAGALVGFQVRQHAACTLA